MRHAVAAEAAATEVCAREEEADNAAAAGAGALKAARQLHVSSGEVAMPKLSEEEEEANPTAHI